MSFLSPARLRNRRPTHGRLSLWLMVVMLKAQATGQFSDAKNGAPVSGSAVGLRLAGGRGHSRGWGRVGLAPFAR